jgi:fucose 4-O-acetylase-like acetyltransferase
MGDGDSLARLRSMDIFKGVAITIIVILHIAIVTKGDVQDPVPPVQALYLGLIGFFIMSGYFFRPGRGFRENMMRRVKVLFLALLVASVAMSVIIFLWCYILGQPTDLDDLLLCIERCFRLERSFVDFDATTPWAICGFSMGYYFLWVLLIACVIFYAVADRIRDNWKLGAAVIAVLLIVTIVYKELFSFSLPFDLNLCPMAAVFMIIGMYLAKIDLVGRMESSKLSNPRFWALFLGSTAALMIMVYLLPPSIDFDYMDFGQYGGYSAIPYVIEGTLAFIMLLFLFFFISKIPGISTVFSELGKHTMGILILHAFIAKAIMAPFFTFNDVVCLTGDLQGLGRVALAFASLVISYLICAYGPAIIKRLTAKSESLTAKQG